VIDVEEAGGAATGFTFGPVTAEALAGALHRANVLWRDQPAWRRLQHNGMSTDVSWRNRASRYAALYQDVVARRRGTDPN
jgi:starch synthase